MHMNIKLCNLYDVRVGSGVSAWQWCVGFNFLVAAASKNMQR